MRKLELTLIHAAREIGALALAFTIGTVALGVNETRAAEDLIDPKAMTILGQMSAYLAGASSFTVKATVLYDHVQTSGIKIKSAAVREVFVRRPGELHVRTQFDDGASRKTWYDGKELVILNERSNEYAKLGFAGNLDQLLDHVIENTEVQLPLADLLYSDIDKTFAESIISAEYVGQRLVDGVLCHQLSLESTGADWQIWIEADDTPVPRRFAIDYVHVPGEPQFLASLTEWRIDPQFEDADFAIKLPQDAREISVDQMMQ